MNNCAQIFSEAFDPKKTSFYKPRKGCLAFSIFNAGKTNILVDGYTQLQPGQSFAYPTIPGHVYDHEQRIKIVVINDASKSNNAKYIVRGVVKKN